MSMYTSLVLCAVAVSLSSLYAESNTSEFNDEYEMLKSECLKKFELTGKDIDAVMESGDVSKINSCYWGCYFKKLGLLNAKGQYDPDNYLITIRKFWNDFSGLEKLSRQCAPVKDKAVKDGEAGCERGALLAACFMKRDD